MPLSLRRLGVLICTCFKFDPIKEHEFSFRIRFQNKTSISHMLHLVHRAGKSGRQDQIDRCTQQCQIPYQKAGAVTQQEIGNFQNRLNRAMMQCNDDAQGMITPDMQHDARKMQKVEDSLLRCIEGVITKSRDGLGPMKSRIESQLS
mmetsp:Transcript_9056/g.18740  ORF Transcript_9056/g.18740 Transcript_9056/m.18740 type:complete len:147 (-) Transcript_9056:154-594(-)